MDLTALLGSESCHGVVLCLYVVVFYLFIVLSDISPGGYCYLLDTPDFK